MYEKVYTALNPIVLDPHYGGISAFLYNKTWDAVFAVSGQRWMRVFHDGSYAAYGRPSGAGNYMGMSGGRFAWVDQWTGTIHPADDIHGIPDLSKCLNPDALINYHSPHYPTTGKGIFVDSTNGLLVSQLDTNHWEVRSLKDLSLVRTIGHHKNSLVNIMNWGGQGIICAFHYATGRVWFVDYLGNKGVFETGSVGPCLFATYDVTCKVFITLLANLKVEVFVRSAIPHSMGQAEFYPTPIQGKKAYSIKVLVTGATGEPSVGWWIHWLLVAAEPGVGPYGWLHRYVSKTDENGYAWNHYFGPRDGEIGDTVLRTWVEI